jgi:hypothetical protein
LHSPAAQVEQGGRDVPGIDVLGDDFNKAEVFPALNV